MQNGATYTRECAMRRSRGWPSALQSCEMSEPPGLYPEGSQTIQPRQRKDSHARAKCNATPLV